VNPTGILGFGGPVISGPLRARQRALAPRATPVAASPSKHAGGSAQPQQTGGRRAGGPAGALRAAKWAPLLCGAVTIVVDSAARCAML